MQRFLMLAIGSVVIGVIMVSFILGLFLLPNFWQTDERVFQYRRLTEDLSFWAVSVPVLFAFAVVGLIVFFREDKKLIAGIVGLLVVGVISVIYLPLALILRPFFSWLVILIPVMSVALFYVLLMYVNDSKSVHWLWSTFLGMLRTAVYLTLAVVFLLPGCQHSEKQEYESKVIMLFDVSGSLFVVDDLPEPGQDPATLLSRQDKILKFLHANRDTEGKDRTPFLDNVLAKTPLTCYRFGGILDETDILNLNTKKNKVASEDDWKKWLKPNKADVPPLNLDGAKNEDERKERMAAHARRLDMVDYLKSNTNIGGAALQAHKIENNSYVQAIIVVSDGQSNLGSDDALTDFRNRVSNPRRPIPVITIGVGQFRLPAAIRIDDIQAPEETRPDDKFPIRVPVVGTNLHDEKFTVTLEATRVKDVTGKPVDEKTYTLGPKEGKFKGAGDHPRDDVEFLIDVAELKGIKADKDEKGELEGEWHFRAKVPRNPKEPFPDPEHVTEPVKVQIQKRALRVLLFAGGATREYQFLRTILYREMVEKRMEMSIHLQTGLEDHMDQDVEPKRMLKDFPTVIGPNEPGNEFMSLSDYDVIVAFDPDWSKLTTKQMNNLKEWVGTHAGGVIFVAGPVFSYQLARPGGRDYTGVLSIYPVVLQDNRLHNVNIGKFGHDSTRPYALNFTPAAKNFDFLKIDEDGKGPTAGWNGFFYNKGEDYVPALGEQPKRGFFTYYPVERIKPGTQVAATFAGPKESRINGGKDEVPFIASMPFGSGKTLFLGSGELWRLRAFKDGYHDRMWIKMSRFVAAGALGSKKNGRILMARNLPVGVVNFEAQVFKDRLPLARELRPTVVVRRIDKNKDEKADLQRFDLQAKPFDINWEGYFAGTLHIKEPGEYEFQLPIPGTTESLRQNLTVRKPNPELDNVRTNFGYLYQLASDAGPLMKNLPPETRKEIEGVLQIPSEANVGEERAMKRLFFTLNSADYVSKCLVQQKPREETIKGRFEDLWDTGYDTEYPMPIWAALLLMLGGIAFVGVVVLLIMRQWIGAIVFFGICVLMAGFIGVSAYLLENVFASELPVNFSYLLLAIVTLLGIEWLARKLLRLA